MIVHLKTTSINYHDLSIGELYLVIGIEAGDYRILNDIGKPYLYPADDFDIFDAQYPQDWQTEYGEDSEQYSYPAALGGIGFFEDFFDNKREQVTIFWRVVNQRLLKAA